MKNAYRITFLHSIECDYWGKNKKKLQAESYLNFNTLHTKYFSLIKELETEARKLKIKDFWYFYEPFIEMTWLADEKTSNKFIEKAKKILEQNNINDLRIHLPEQGWHPDWFCCNDRELEFGAKRHTLSFDFVNLIEQYREDIEKGKGVKEQVKRTIHTICNPLGLNYMDEAYICFSRGLICLLFRFFSFKKAVWIYTKIFRQKY